MPPAVAPLTIIAATLAAYGAGGGTGAQESAAAPRSSVPAASGVANPLIGTWSRTTGDRCWADQVEFAATRMSYHQPGTTGDLPTVRVIYDLSDPQAPKVLAEGRPPIGFRVRDAGHLVDPAGCVLARAD